jgi:serine kinase of HPr protein (carbohydrate metabolism regulator)
MTIALNIHGTGLVLDGAGILLRGPSGAGKSILALALLERFETRGLDARLVGDDRIDIVDDGTGLTMVAPKSLAGLIELRGRGIVQRPHAQSARLTLIVDLVPDLIRMVEEDQLVTELAGYQIARAPVPSATQISLGHQELLVLEALRASAKVPLAT